MILYNASPKIRQANVVKGSEARCSSGPFSLHLTSPSLECRWGGCPPLSRLIFWGGVPPVAAKGICHREGETIYAGVLSNKKGGNAYEVILGDVIGDRNFKGGF